MRFELSLSDVPSQSCVLWRLPVEFVIASAHDASLGYWHANRLAASTALHHHLAARLFRR
jgi:hypothetical protein